MSSRGLSGAEVAQRRQAGLVHGARSPRKIAAKARNAKRRFLSRQRLRATDLDGIAVAYLDGWARAMAKCELYDDFDGLHGSREYIACQNSARLWMAKLEQRLRVLNLDKAQRPAGSALREHIEREYGAGRKP